MICPIVIATVKGHGLAVLLESIKQYAPECPVYLRGPEPVIERFDADYKLPGLTRPDLVRMCELLSSRRS